MERWLWRSAFTPAIVWTVFIVVLLGAGHVVLDMTHDAMERNDAVARLEQYVGLVHWAADHGAEAHKGEAETPLSLLAHLNKGKGVQVHLFSETPLNRDNVPDRWERQELDKLVRGGAPYSFAEASASHSFTRILAPLPLSENCRACHGQMRGAGLSLTIPVESSRATSSNEFGVFALFCFVLWSVGFMSFTMHLRVVNTKVKQQQAVQGELERSLGEKETLLKEIHHRVKNNMQVVSSLLSLQSMRMQDDQDIELTRATMDRVRSMALVHERLYRSGELSRVDFGYYLGDVSSHLRQAYGADKVDVVLQCNSEEVFLAIDQAVPCGLVANELITNAFKHAFTKSHEGKRQILVRLYVHDGIVELEVSDNGGGLTPEKLPEGTFGATIVQSLAKQLGGTFEYKKGEGTHAVLTFSLKSGEETRVTP